MYSREIDTEINRVTPNHLSRFSELYLLAKFHEEFDYCIIIIIIKTITTPDFDSNLS